MTPERKMQAYAKMMATITTAAADALAAGVTTESVIAALNELVRLLEEV